MRKFKDLLKNRWFVAGAVALLLFFLVSEYGQLRQRYSVNKEIQALKNQSDELRRTNKEMQDLIAYFNTDDYKEKSAREQMNLKKEGEFVYSFAAQDDLNQQSQTTKQEATEAEQSNPAKWWNYFFNN